MNSSEMGKKGAKKRWHGKSKRERTKEMSRVAKLRWDSRKPKRSARLSNADIRRGPQT
jgi:hypothetical protein